MRVNDLSHINYDDGSMNIPHKSTGLRCQTTMS